MSAETFSGSPPAGPGMPHAFAPRIRALDRTRNAHAFLRFPVSLGYSGGILGEIGRFTLLILAGVEAIYLSDLLVFEFLPRVLAFQGNAVDVLELLVLATPQGLFLALPFVLSIGSVVFLPLVTAIVLTIILSPLADKLASIGLPGRSGAAATEA